MTDRASFYVTRAFIGLFEGGFIPGTVLMATYFYTSRELSVRLAAFWSTLNIASRSFQPSCFTQIRRMTPITITQGALLL